MKTATLLILILFTTLLNAQTNKPIKVEADVYTHTQADVDAKYSGFVETKNTAWNYYNSGDYETALYYAKRIVTDEINDRGYLVSEKVRLLCLTYARLGNNKESDKFYKKAERNCAPDVLRSLDSELKNIQNSQSNNNNQDQWFMNNSDKYHQGLPQSEPVASQSTVQSETDLYVNAIKAHINVGSDLINLPTKEIISNLKIAEEVLILKVNEEYPDYYYVDYAQKKGYIIKSAVTIP